MAVLSLLAAANAFVDLPAVQANITAVTRINQQRVV